MTIVHRIRHLGPWLLLAVIFATDVSVRLYLASNNTDFLIGDGLAPFSILDQFYHGESVDLSRQSWLLPWCAAQVLRLIGGFQDFHSLFSAYAMTTAVASSLCLPLTYVVARRLLGPFESLVPVILLACNASFLLASSFPNPTQVYGLLFLLTVVAMMRVSRERLSFVWSAMFTATLAMLVRWEGALLLVLSAGLFVIWAARRTIPRFVGPAAAIIALASLGTALAIHSYASSTPFGFLINTNAVAPPLSAFERGWSNLLGVFVGSLSWKFQMLHALDVNVTTPGLILAGVGGTAVLAKRPLLLFPVVYWLAYEAVIFVFTLVLPVGNIVNPQFVDILSTGPIHRYYQILSPFILIFAYVGLRQLLLLLRRPAVRIAAACLLLLPFLLQQTVIARNTFEITYAPFARHNLRANLIEAADYFRLKNLRRRNVAVARLVGDKLVYADVFQSGVDGYTFHVFHFSIISGRNLTNCTGENLDNPNLFCSRLTNSSSVDLDSSPVGGRADFVLLVKPFPPQTAVPGFDRVFDNDDFRLFQRRPS